jgi:eukaryotic-like serine/threonine-protein kinase
LLEPGQIFASRYRVLRCVAQGGMGAIFEAEHTATERRVALKLLFPHIMSVASARKKFELEARISARVNSPYIVEVLDAGFDEATQSPFLVMELLDGQTLAARVAEQGPIEPEQALRLLEQLAAGLDAAHGYREPSGQHRPIVHRDLKPENLFLARQRDGSINAKILDFGIAKVLGDTGNISHEVRGTPLFMSIEQITAGTLSPQTDVWAFGLLAYHMLTGTGYWRSAARQDVSVQSLFAEILTLPFVAPSVRLREQNSAVELPAAFDDWLLRCIDREPSGRFASAGAAVEALAQVLERAPRAITKAAPEPGSDNAQTFSAPAAPVNALPVGSVPAMATTRHRRAFPAALLLTQRPHWGAAGAVGGALLLLGVVVWLAAGDVAPSDSVATPGVAPSGAATPGAAPSGAAPSTSPEPSTESVPADPAPQMPRIRVAPLDDRAPAPQVTQAPHPAPPEPAPSVQPTSRAQPTASPSQHPVSATARALSPTKRTASAPEPPKPKKPRRPPPGSTEAYKLRR